MDQEGLRFGNRLLTPLPRWIRKPQERARFRGSFPGEEPPLVQHEDIRCTKQVRNPGKQESPLLSASALRMLQRAEEGLLEAEEALVGGWDQAVERGNPSRKSPR